MKCWLEAGKKPLLSSATLVSSAAPWHGRFWKSPPAWHSSFSTKLYVLISWPDGSRVINVENIKEPRKPFHLYTVGEQVLARCPGFSGLYWGVVEGISGEKTFPKWTHGNASRKYPSDRTYPAKPLLRVAEASLPHDAGSSSILKDRHVLGGSAGSPRSLAAPPHPASAFTAPSAFITMAMPGPGTSQGEEDRAAPAARGNLGFCLCCLVLSSRVGWGAAEQPENLCFALGLCGLFSGLRRVEMTSSGSLYQRDLLQESSLKGDV
uniref:Uncharacterized protein n=1 Tax=Malurus cyaneus samueli TaxID=2593467 RepID=A0A8C5TB71_9PASS